VQLHQVVSDAQAAGEWIVSTDAPVVRRNSAGVLHWWRSDAHNSGTKLAELEGSLMSESGRRLVPMEVNRSTWQTLQQRGNTTVRHDESGDFRASRVQGALCIYAGIPEVAGSSFHAH
jgi:hypothetical protein